MNSDNQIYVCAADHFGSEDPKDVSFTISLAVLGYDQDDARPDVCRELPYRMSDYSIILSCYVNGEEIYQHPYRELSQALWM